MIGNKFGMLLVIKDSGKRTNDRGMIWTCKCDCGTIKDVSFKLLKNEKKPRSCGCSRKINSRKIFDSNIQKTETCWLWTGCINKSGYGKIGTKDIASRRAYKYFIGEIPKGLQVCHKCDNRACVNPSHLFLGTIGDNMRDRTSKNRQAKGSKIGNSIVTEETVLEIRRMRISGLEYQVIADKFKIGWDLTRKICKNEGWKHVALGEESRKVKQVRRVAIGSQCGQAKLNEEQVIEIKEMFKSGIRSKEIADLFGVSQATICDIKSKRTWKHLP